jgi:hypothetical protein
MDDEPLSLVILDWHEGMEVPIPPDYRPVYVDLGGGKTIDQTRLYFICDAIIFKHPDRERLQRIAAERPGLDMESLPSGMMAILLGGEPIGLFDPKLLDARLTPNVAAKG